MKARCCWPPDSVAMGSLARSARPTRSMDDSTSSVVRPQASNGAPPRDPARAHDLLHGHRRLDPELRTLGEVADAVALPKAAGRLAEERRRPGLRLLEPEQDTEQRRLAPAVRSGHGHELTLLHGETHVAEH